MPSSPSPSVVYVRAPRATVVDTVTLPGDKSISHRAIMFAAVARGRSVIRRPLLTGDAEASIAFARALGATVTHTGSDVVVEGSTAIPERVEVNCGRSGTTLRLGAGMLCGLGCAAHLSADPQLLARPMARIVTPMQQLGADLQWTETGMVIAARRAPLRAVTYEAPVPSAQVKSAVLLAGALGGVRVNVRERVRTRDHTERLLAAMGIDVRIDAEGVSVHGTGRPVACDIDVPGDMSSAATIAAAAALLPGAQVTLANVGDNPTRTAFWGVLEKMGAKLEHTALAVAGPEPAARVCVRGGSPLNQIVLTAHDVATLIDEVMLIALLACAARGTSEIRNAGELRVKESDRLAALVRVLRLFGAQIETSGDDLHITGPARFHPATVRDTARDHRVVFLAALAGLRASDLSEISGAKYAHDSFPLFFSVLERWGAVSNAAVA